MLTRVSQIGIKAEASEGTPETLVAADYAGNFKATDHSYQTGRYARELDQPALSERAELSGSRLGMIKCTQEAAGGGAATEAPWHRAMQGLGFAKTQLKVCDVGAITNTFVAGELVGNNASQGSATKTARIAKVITGSPNRVVLMPVTGTFQSGDSIFGYTSSPQPTCTISSSLTNAGYGFAPLSETDAAAPSAFTVERRVGGQKHQITAARATGALTIERDAPLLVRTEFTGPAVLGGDTPALASPLTGIASLPAAPKIGKGLPVKLGAYTPVLTRLEVAVNNTLSPRETIANNDFQSSGYQGTRITQRQIALNVNPLHVLPSGAIDFYQLATLGTAFTFSCELGSASDASHGLVVLAALAAQLPGDIGVADRNGEIAHDLAIKLTGSGDDELFVFHVFA